LVRMDTDVKGLKPILDDIERFTRTDNEHALCEWQSITINDLVYHHTPNVEVFNNLSLTLKRGEKIALIGFSGGGKSTLLNIIRGLYVAKQVNLIIDDVSFNTLEPLQTLTTLIPQDPEIFENTVAFNITLDVPASTDEIEQAMRLSAFHKVLPRFPLGLATDICEKGQNLSFGQKQRLALARGLFAARYSSIILMDEPTSSIDLPTETEILTNVIQAFPNSTLIVSLHRLHLLPKFDRIIMLDHGKVLADGPTQELLNQDGPVYKLWQSANLVKA
ncbi:MAG TPA: ATP-binding cassette domain-containing protein, partial [Gammaproteobacteria bacterium]|nr:ATP-binding cassette domain-containing protein [Gammaproteobacteria bacterium]